MRERLIRLAVSGLRRLSWKGLLRAGGVIGWIWHFLLPLRGAVMQANLRRVFPEKDAAWRRSVIRACRRHFVLTGLELLWLPNVDRPFVEQHVRFLDRELPGRLLERGKGLICVGGHFGSWEMMGAATCLAGYPLSYIVKRINDPFLDELINASRKSAGVDVIYTREAGRKVLRELKRNRLLAFLSDQDARSRGVFVDFLGHPASTPTGAAVYALRLKAPVMFVHDRRLPDGNHEIDFREIPVDPDWEASEENVLALTQRFTDLMAEEVRRLPEQWFWMHKRWKTTPAP